jgi:hemerythrin-like domain-containing protein
MIPPALTPEDFAQLLAEHRQLIDLANELELSLYRIGDQPNADNVQQLQQTAGALIGLLRHVLFRHDQQVLPTLEALMGQK